MMSKLTAAWIPLPKERIGCVLPCPQSSTISIVSEAGGGNKTSMTVFLPAGTLNDTLFAPWSMLGVKSVLFREALCRMAVAAISLMVTFEFAAQVGSNPLRSNEQAIILSQKEIARVHLARGAMGCQASIPNSVGKVCSLTSERKVG